MKENKKMDGRKGEKEIEKARRNRKQEEGKKGT